jgi:5-methylcytosine-specific restriction protein A
MPRRPCLERGCPRFAIPGEARCETHRRPGQWRGWRGSTRRGSTRQWRAQRARVLARDRGICQLRLPCCTVLATTVDHRVPVSVTGTEDVSDDGLQSACVQCHRRKTADEATAARWHRDARDVARE